MARRKRYAAALICALLMTVCAGARADAWYVFSPESMPRELRYVPVCEYTGMLRLSFLGDCTLGGESKTRASRYSFARTVEREGMAFPLDKLRPLLENDDVSVVNLEGVLSDGKLERETKQFCFQGAEAYARVLTLGGVELAGLANNHARDYGEEGYQDTRQALQAAGIASFGPDHVAMWEHDGLRIGFTGSAFAVRGESERALEAQMKALQEAGCQLIVHSMHGGTEYEYTPGARQRETAELAVRMGASLVVGHHPHVAQGMEWVNGVPVIYSLGNAVFGGNTRPRDMDAVLLQALVIFENGEVVEVRPLLWPIRISSERSYNNYQPVLLDGDDALRVKQKLEKSTGTALRSVGEGGAPFAPEKAP